MSKRLNFDNIVVQNGRKNQTTLSNKENAALYKRLEAGEDVAHEIIVGNAPLVFLKVTDFLAENPEYSHLKCDLQSEGFLALCNCVNNPQPIKETPKAYYRKAIYNAIHKAAVESEAFGPHWTVVKEKFRDRREGNAEFALPARSEIDADNFHAADRWAAMRLLHTVESCAKDDIDLKIILMRRMRFVDDEIARHLSIERSAVTYRRQNLYKRLKEVIDWI